MSKHGAVPADPLTLLPCPSDGAKLYRLEGDFFVVRGSELWVDRAGAFASAPVWVPSKERGAKVESQGEPLLMLILHEVYYPRHGALLGPEVWDVRAMSILGRLGVAWRAFRQARHADTYRLPYRGRCLTAAMMEDAMNAAAARDKQIAEHGIEEPPTVQPSEGDPMTTLSPLPVDPDTLLPCPSDGAKLYKLEGEFFVVRGSELWVDRAAAFAGSPLWVPSKEYASKVVWDGKPLPISVLHDVYSPPKGLS